MADKQNRDTKGRFVKGSPGGPGRPRGERAYLDAMLNAVSLDDWQKATAKMLTLAQAGDVNAFKAVVPYLAGLPVQKLQLDAKTAALLGELLDLYRARGYDASEIFSAMIAAAAQAEKPDHA